VLNIFCSFDFSIVLGSLWITARGEDSLDMTFADIENANDVSHGGAGTDSG
jgi:hypothetical protein